ncbi:MAG: RiPP maturation radical SAM protein 1 [Algicola sp.]|nr:RiPP maturation radical SAM protein 1 [Algicola sp.]
MTTDDMTTDICLLSMPYASLERPCLALGLLETYISAYGYQVESLYGNLHFAALTGIEHYFSVENTDSEKLIGEWTFSRAAFPDDFSDPLQDDVQYLASLGLTTDAQQRLKKIREQAALFIDQLAEKVLATNPKIVGCSSTFQQNCASLALLRKIKAADPSIITVMGGANCEGVMGQTISKVFGWVDYVFSGECDEVIGEFIDQLIKGFKFSSHNLPEGVIANTANLIVSDVEQPRIPRAFVENMDKVGIPNYDSYFTTIESLGLSEVIDPGLVVETSRGCWWGAKRQCTFCGLNGASMAHRVKKPEAVFDEFEQLANKYHIDKIGLTDNILPMDYIETVLPHLAELQRYSMFYETKANLRQHHIEKLAAAGVKWIQPGLESLHDDFLKLIKKGSTAIGNMATLKWCRENGIRISWNLLSHAPDEQESWYKDMAQWVPLITHLQPPQQELVPIGYHRFSPYFDKADEYGLDIRPVSRYRYVYPLNDENLFNLAYFFEGKTGVTILPGHQLLQDEVIKWSTRYWTQQMPPILSMTDHDSLIRILDTRPVATKMMHELKDLKAAVYRLCLAPVSKERLLINLNKPDATVTIEQLDEQLNQLIDDKLMIFVSHCYLSLALLGSIPALPTVIDYPSGYLHVDPRGPISLE